MKYAELKSKMSVSSPAGAGMNWFAKFCLTFFSLALILSATLFFGARTKYCRSLVEDMLEKRLGAEVSVGRTKIGWPYALVIEKIACGRMDSGEGPGITIEEARIGFGAKTLWRARIRRCALNLVEDSDRTWSPAVFSSLKDLPWKNVTDISRVTETLRGWLQLSVTDSSITWHPYHGEKVWARGISFDMTPASIPGRKMCHYAMTIYNARGSDGIRLDDIEREWLSSEEREYIELDRSDHGIPDSARSFWEPDPRNSAESSAME